MAHAIFTYWVTVVNPAWLLYLPRNNSTTPAGGIFQSLELLNLG